MLGSVGDGGGAAMRTGSGGVLDRSMLLDEEGNERRGELGVTGLESGVDQ